MKALLLSAMGWATVIGAGFAGCQQSPQRFTQATAAVGVEASRLISGNQTALISRGAELVVETSASGSIQYSICAQVNDWDRSTESEHMRQLEEIPRYGKTIRDEPLRSLLADFRSFPIISFTTYGLSARSEPLYLTGVWTALDEIETCYSQGQPAQITNGELGETWLMGYRVNDLTWSEGVYLLSVEPAEGLQILQFERQEELASLPLQVVEADGGAAVPVQSGDYPGSW